MTEKTDVLERLWDAKHEALFDTKVANQFRVLLDDAIEEIMEMRDALREIEAKKFRHGDCSIEKANAWFNDRARAGLSTRQESGTT